MSEGGSSGEESPAGVFEVGLFLFCSLRLWMGSGGDGSCFVILCSVLRMKFALGCSLKERKCYFEFVLDRVFVSVLFCSARSSLQFLLCNSTSSLCPYV